MAELVEIREYGISEVVAEAFLANHLGRRYQLIGGDFSGSSLKIEIGGELVPGISG